MSASQMLFAIVSIVALSGVQAKQPRAKTAIRILSEEPRIEYFENFISATDAAALRELATGLGFEALDEAGSSRETNGGHEVCVLNRTAVVDEVIDETDAKLTADGWAVAARFEAAASKWAKLPLGSAPTVITRWDSWLPGSNRSGPLHLDSRFRPFHQRTVLAYLGSRSQSATPKGNSEPGFTVFPCVETEEMEAKEVKRRQRICSRAFRHVKLTQERLLKTHAQGLELKPSQQYKFLEEHPELTALPKVVEGGVRPTNWQWTATHDAVAESPDALRADPLFALADAMCHGKAPGLRIRPEVGAAVLFESAAAGRDGALVPDWQMWHAGCSAGRGQGRRWTAQLFLDGADARRPGQVAEVAESLLVGDEKCAAGGDQSKQACAKEHQA